MHPYDYATNGSGFNISLLAGTSQRSHHELTFPAPRTMSYQEANTVYADYFTPAAKKTSPLTILVPGMGDNSLVPCINLARQLVKVEIAALVLYLPFHSRRLPSPLKGNYQPTTVQDWLGIHQASVAEIRRIVDWAASREEIDSKRIGVAGISLGGMISAIGMALEPRISGGVFVVTGGNLEELSWGGAEKVLGTGHTCTREDCHRVYSQYPSYLENIVQAGIENVVPARECFLFDPLTFVSRLRGRPVLMINAERDEIVPQKAVLEFWQGCGKPPLKWLPATHLSIYSYTPLIGEEIAHFLKSIS
jgi:predicted esterase